MAYASLPVKDAAAVPANPDDPLAAALPKLKLGGSLVRWLSGLRGEVDARPKRATHEVLEGLHASLATTPLPIGTLSQGIWRISTTVRVTTPGSVSSSIQVSVLWTERGIVQIESGTALAGNLTTTREGKTVIIRIDAETPISISTIYASVGATAMQYSLDVVAEELAVDA